MPKAYKTELASAERSCALFNYVEEGLIPSILEVGQVELAEKIKAYSQPLKNKGLRDRISTHFRRGWSVVSELEERRDFFLRQLSILQPEEKMLIKKFAKADLKEVQRKLESEDYYSCRTGKNLFSPEKLKESALCYIVHDVPD